jgi:hypothetical protein
VPAATLSPLPSLSPPLQALCISVLEEQLYVPSHQELVGEAMYPPYLVLATSALGLAAAHKLMVRGRLLLLDCSLQPEVEQAV